MALNVFRLEGFGRYYFPLDKAMDQAIHKSRVLRSDETLIFTVIQYIYGNKKLAANSFVVSTPEVIPDTKYSFIN